MNRKIVALAGLLLCGAIVPASAGDGFYAGLGAGWADQNNISLDELRAPFASGQISTNDGAIIAGTLGFKFPLFPVRLEFESGYDWHSVSNFTGFGGSGAAVSGHNDIASELFNAIYDLPVGPGWNLYGGAGIGTGHVHFAPTLSATGTSLGYVDHWALMWQVIGGVSFEIAPDADLFVDYRYRSARARDIADVAPVGPVVTGQTSENVVMAGARFYLFPAFPSPP